MAETEDAARGAVRALGVIVEVDSRRLPTLAELKAACIRLKVPVPPELAAALKQPADRR